MTTQTLVQIDPRIQPVADILAAKRCPDFPRMWALRSPVPLDVARRQFRETATELVAAADNALMIRTPEELDNLPIGSTLRSGSGIIHKKFWMHEPSGRIWGVIGDVFPRSTASIALPATLIPNGLSS